MKIAKSKGVEDIGNMEEKLKELGGELAMVRHVESCKRAKLQEENELLKKQLQLQEVHKEDRLSILGGKQQQGGPPTDKDTTEK